MDDRKESGNIFGQENGANVLKNTEEELNKDRKQFAACHSAEKLMPYNAATNLQ